MSTALANAALAIAAIVFHSFWEGALIVGAVWLGLRCLPKLGAATRYAIWLCALLALVLIPALTAELAQQSSAAQSAAAQPVVVRVDDPAVATARSSAHVDASGLAPLGQPRAGSARVSPRLVRVESEPATIAPAAAKSRITIPRAFALAIALLWLSFACARAVRLLLDVRALAAIRRDARLWSAAYDYPVFVSDRVHVPIAVGFRRAAIILPGSLVEQLGADALDTVVVHEVAHLRRNDVWTNALARVAEALVTLNPAAWFVMRRLSMEREIACDDWVVARTGAGDAFAHTLLELASRPGRYAPLAAASVLGSRHSVVVRIERLLDTAPRRLRLSPSALGGALMVLALIALVVQTVSPVLAYAPPTARHGTTVAQVASACAMPNRTIRLDSFLGLKARHLPHFLPAGVQLPEASKVVPEAGAVDVVTLDLTVDASGRPRNVTVHSGPRYPGMSEHVARLLMAQTYLPALRDCVPVTATIHTAVRFGKPISQAYSIVSPVYPRGWSARYASACKVPTVQHGGVPAFPDSMRNLPVDATYNAAVRVHVDAAGAVTNAAVVGSSGQKSFDDALLAAARRATYPLADDTGFKQARPAHASLAWNAAHGSDTYARCKPLPTDYVWNTTYGTIVPVAVPGTTAIFQSAIRAGAR